jgi:hypothetical protein
MPGQCTLKATAWCFTARHVRGDGGFAQCAPSKGDCSTIRKNLVELGDLRDESACAEME